MNTGAHILAWPRALIKVNPGLCRGGRARLYIKGVCRFSNVFQRGYIAFWGHINH